MPDDKARQSSMVHETVLVVKMISKLWPCMKLTYSSSLNIGTSGYCCGSNDARAAFKNKLLQLDFLFSGAHNIELGKPIVHRKSFLGGVFSIVSILGYRLFVVCFRGGVCVCVRVQTLRACFWSQGDEQRF